MYRKVPKFSDTQNGRCNHTKIQTKHFSIEKFVQKGANRMTNSADPDQTAPTNSVDPDQTAPLGAV